MKFINNTFCLEFKDMVAAGVPEVTIKMASSRSSNAFDFIDDPEDARKKLIVYSSLNDYYKAVLKDRFGDPMDFYYRSKIREYVTHDDRARDFFFTYKDADKVGLGDKAIAKYIQQAEWLQFIAGFNYKKHGFTRDTFYNTLFRIFTLENIKLPTNYSRLKGKIRALITPSGPDYASLITKGQGNKNRACITNEVGEWLIANYALPTKPGIMQLWLKYNQEAIKRGWKQITDSSTIYKYLHKHGIGRKWYGGRHGFELAKEKYGYPLKTDLPTFRDALWYSDGTKLNYFDFDGQLKAAYTFYAIIDVFSEVILGWSIGATENHTVQYAAAKMALNFSGAKAYEWRYDNQGGHKKLAKAEVIGGKSLFDKLTKINFATQPNNGKSKTIENVFGRFQTQVMRGEWFYTGQNITAKKQDSKLNLEFLLKHLKDLPTIKDLQSTLEENIYTWNNTKHPHLEETRIQAYTTSNNPYHQPFTAIDMVEVFWLEQRSLTYFNDGITIRIKKNKYTFEVLNADGLPDLDFRKTYIDKKFIVKYDLEDLTTIRLYDQTETGIKFIAIAQPRISVPRATVDQKDGDRQMISTLLQVRKDEVRDMKEELVEIENNTGISRNNLVNNTGRKNHNAPSFGQVMKEQSYQSDINEDFIYDI